MKKGLFLSIMLFAVFVFGNCVPALAIFADHDAFVIAKAVKLGRGNAYSVVANSEINTAQNELKKGECEENSDCSGNKRCINNKCVDYCYNISCIAGYTTEENSNGCCCVSLCSDNCTNCSSSGSCTQCKSGYYLSSGSCYAEKTCIANCSSCDKTTGKCSACISGYTLGSNNLACIKDVTSCSAGYYLSGNSCKLCSYGTYSFGGTATSCKSCSTLYVGSNKTCTRCSQSGVCTGSNGGSSSSSGSSGSTCPSGNMTGYTCVNGVKTKCLYTGCSSCASDTLKCISCKPGYKYTAGSNCSS